MARSDQWVKISGYLFLLGILISVVDGVGVAIPSAETYLVVIGFIVGLLATLGMGSVSKNQTEMFLLATIALVVAGSAGAVLSGVYVIGPWLAAIAGNIAALVAPAAVLMAIKAVWDAAAVRFR